MPSTPHPTGRLRIANEPLSLLHGFAHCQLGESGAALAAYNRAIELSPDDPARQEYSQARARASMSDPAAC